MHLITAVPAMVSEMLGARDQARGEHDQAHQIYGAITNLSTRGVGQVQGAVTSAMKKPAKKTTEDPDEEPTSVKPTGGEGKPT